MLDEFAPLFIDSAMDFIRAASGRSFGMYTAMKSANHRDRPTARPLAVASSAARIETRYDPLGHDQTDLPHSGTHRVGSVLYDYEAAPPEQPRENASQRSRPTVRLKRPLETALRAPEITADPVNEVITVVPPPLGPPRTVSSEAMLNFGSLVRVAVVTLTPAELRKRPLDPESAFILSLLDGHTTLESALDACPLEAQHAMRILGSLLAQGIIAMK